MMYDVIIVGGGVAGLYLANLLRNKKVLLIEEHKNLGPIRCSGIVSKRINDFFDLPKNIIEREVNDAFVICGNIGVRMFLESLVINKEKFENFLLSRAKRNAEIRFERVNKISETYKDIVVSTSRKEYRTKYIAGCDGSNSIVRRTFLNEEPKKFYFGKFCYSLEKPFNYYSIFLDSIYSDLFSWIAPRKGRVEYGLICEKKLNEYYDRFITEKKPKDKKDDFFGVIPTGLCKCSFPSGVLIGNSAGMTKPLTGGGIIYSLTAAKIAAREFNKKNPDFGNYEKECRKIFGKEIKYQLWARKIYSKLNDKQKQKLIKILAKSKLKIDMDFPITNILKNHKMKVLRGLFGKS